jgi:hypothetical protein
VVVKKPSYRKDTGKVENVVGWRNCYAETEIQNMYCATLLNTENVICVKLNMQLPINSLNSKKYT